TVLDDGNADPNALAPQRVEIDLADGRTVGCTIKSVLGSPARPLSPEAARAKFTDCWRSVSELLLRRGKALWDAIAALETLDDVRVLPALTHGRERDRQRDQGAP